MRVTRRLLTELHNLQSAEDQACGTMMRLFDEDVRARPELIDAVNVWRDHAKRNTKAQEAALPALMRFAQGCLDIDIVDGGL